ncbi:MAG TPA: hypothetical protein VFB45_27845 [Pseudolabrys sp.]|nr:hypothetical protein [Pseudolabrys sp.]
MPSIAACILCAFAALVLWGAPGYALSRRMVPPALALPMAPALGFAVHSVLALPLFAAIGMQVWTVAAGFLLPLVVAIAVLAKSPAEKLEGPRVPPLTYALAAVAAALIGAALLPKISAGGVALAPPIFDHSKIALIDEMARAGVPPVDPVFAEPAASLPLAYYYLWHFAAAELSVLTGVHGWTADIALTGFTAFASLALLAGIATWIAGRPLAGILVVPLAFAGSLHFALDHTLGADAIQSVLIPPTGFAGWLFQSSWAPQHVASATCVVISALLLARLIRSPSLLIALVLGASIAAAYQSSIWVGGIVGAMAYAVMAAALLIRAPQKRDPLLMLAIAAVIAAILSLPFLRAQLVGAAARGIAHPIELTPFPVLNVWVPEPLRHLLDIPAFWLIQLLIEFPEIYLPGVAALVAVLRTPASPPIKDGVLALTCLIAVSLLTASVLAFTLADNNDLGWRAVLPGVLVLIIFAAVGLARWLTRPARFAAAGALVLLALGLIDSADLMRENLRGWPSVQGQAFAQAPALWDAVRRHTAPDERVADNPALFDKVTTWPANISWALFADRRSCYAGRELALPFAPLPLARIEELEAQFRRVFAGKPEPDDLRDLALRYHCKVVVVTPQDGAWHNDPFAKSALYTLVEEQPERWRIYRAR